MCVSDDDKKFLSSALEESLIPLFLVSVCVCVQYLISDCIALLQFYLNDMEVPMVSVSVFSMIDSLLQLVSSDQAMTLAQTLCKCVVCGM